MAGTLISSLTQITQARLINLRWLSVLAMLAAALISPNILGSASLMPRLLAFATFIAAINACLHLAQVFNSGSSEGLPMFSPLIQLFFDLTSWGSYIYLSGGASNPLISIFLPLVAIGAIVLGRAQAWLLGATAILTYSFLWRYHQPLAIADSQTATHLHLLGMWLVFVVSAIVVIWFILQMTRAVRERDTALAEAREQAIRNDWLISMGSLAAGAAHELSTPLATLSLLIDEWMDEAVLPDALRPDLGLMQRQVATCKQALTQLTLRAGHSRDGGADAPSDMALDTWLNGIVGAWQALHPRACIIGHYSEEFGHCSAPLDIPLERALTNLLDNADKANASEIKLHGKIVGQHLALSIDDNGHGISSAELAAFASGTPIMSATGMGIGLLLSRTAIERLGGTLSLQARAAGGTRAHLDLPLPEKPEAVT